MYAATASALNLEPDLRYAPLGDLWFEAAAQERRYARGESSDDAAGLELFRRAIDDGDHGAWHVIVEVYRGLLVAQAARHVTRSLITEPDSDCVDRAFERFWRATRSGRAPRFNDLAGVLKYLKLCLGSVLVDEARARRRRPSVPIDDVSPDAVVSADPSGEVINRLARRELWEVIRRELDNPDERLVAYLSFVAALSPREILARHPSRFPNAMEIYRVKRCMIERLRRSRALQRLLEKRRQMDA
jgi:hypothetical protein